MEGANHTYGKHVPDLTIDNHLIYTHEQTFRIAENSSDRLAAWQCKRPVAAVSS